MKDNKTDPWAMVRGVFGKPVAAGASAK
jgi:hypothetical protein